MKRLTLIRHAKSSWRHPEQADFDRPLNKRGEHDAPAMGKRLSRRKVQPDLIISSPARRALTTASVIAQELGYPAERIIQNEHIYDASLSDLVRVIEHVEDRYHHVMLFGHNPGFTELSYYLTRHQVDNIPTCGVFCMDFAINSWQDVEQGSGSLVFFDYPKQSDE